MSTRNGVYVPQMPAFQPATDDAAKASMLSQAVTENDHFSFPADRDFWNNFVTQVRMYPGAMNHPQFHVDASHTDESVLVNQEFMRRFVAGWQNANPHVVTINSPQGQATFHSSEDFWSGFVMLAGERSRARAARGEGGLEDYTVASSRHPNQPPIRTTAADWNEYCHDWDAKLQQPPQEQFFQPSPMAVREPEPVMAMPMPVAPMPQPDPMVPQLKAQLETQRQQLGNATAQIDGTRRQAEELQRQLNNINHQAQLSSSQLQDELRRAQGEAQRNATDAEALRDANRKLHGERDGLASRVKKLEHALTTLQGDMQKQRDICHKELAQKERDMEELQQLADLADLKKELQMRELMQEELFKAKEEVQREADEKCRIDLMKHEAKNMRTQLCYKQQAQNQCLQQRPQCVPQCGPPAIHFAGQRTVATQTAPKARPPMCFPIRDGPTSPVHAASLPYPQIQYGGGGDGGGGGGGFTSPTFGGGGGPRSPPHSNPPPGHTTAYSHGGPPRW